MLLVSFFDLGKHVEVVCNQKTLKVRCKQRNLAETAWFTLHKAALRTTSSGFKLFCVLVLAAPNFNIRHCVTSMPHLEEEVINTYLTVC